MTSPTRMVAGGLTVVEGLWLVYSYYDVPYFAQNCASNGCFVLLYSVWTPVLAVVLIAMGALGAWGASFAYPAAAASSGVALALAGYSVAALHGYPAMASDDAIIGVAFALVALIVNLEATRSKSGLSEQANPMNLPVFG